MIEIHWFVFVVVIYVAFCAGLVYMASKRAQEAPRE